MISVTVCTLIPAGQLDTAKSTTPRKDEIELVLVRGPGVSL